MREKRLKYHGNAIRELKKRIGLGKSGLIEGSPSTTLEKKSGAGFTMMEMLVVVAIIAILTTLVTINFRAQREQQELQAAVSDMISRVREVQSNLLAGKVVAGGLSAKAYQINFSAGSGTFDIVYNTGSVTSTPQTISVAKNSIVQQVLVGGAARNPTSVYFRAPFGKITVVGVGAGQTVQIDIQHQQSSQVRGVIIDGVSGRIGAQ